MAHSCQQSIFRWPKCLLKIGDLLLIPLFSRSQSQVTSMMLPLWSLYIKNYEISHLCLIWTNSLHAPEAFWKLATMTYFFKVTSSNWYITLLKLHIPSVKDCRHTYHINVNNVPWNGPEVCCIDIFSGSLIQTNLLHFFVIQFYSYMSHSC